MAISSEVQLANLALLRLGERTITSLEDSTTTANACNIAYSTARDALLRRHFWNFSLKRVVLAADATAPSFGFQSSFPLPSDFIRVKSIYNQSSDYSIEGRNLLTDQTSSLSLVYVSKETDVTLFDPLFTDALVLLLILKIGPRIQGEGFNPAGFAQELQQVLLDAKIADAQDSSPDQLEINTFTGARTGNDGWNYTIP